MPFHWENGINNNLISLVTGLVKWRFDISGKVVQYLKKAKIFYIVKWFEISPI